MIEYDAHDWRGHLFDIRGSMVREIIGRVTVCIAWSVAVVYVHMHWRPLGIPSTVHSLVGVALGLLLVFRTNASYARFWEGRQLWGGIVNETRNIVRSSRAVLGLHNEAFTAIVRWTIAFPYATMFKLRSDTGVGSAARLLEASELAGALAAQHVPLGIASRITGLLARERERGTISDYLYVAIDQNVQLLVDYLGACERIHNTPLPFAYVVHLRRALIFYCFSLPMALVESFGWWAVIATSLVAYTFFGIEEIGVEIEDPFGYDDNDLPLEKICGNIEKNLLAFLDPNDRATIAPPSPESAGE